MRASVEAARNGHRRPSLQSIYIHHIAWGSLCLLLFATVVGMWFMTQSLDQKTAALEQRLEAKTVTPSCTARDAWTGGQPRTFSVDTGDTKRDYIVHLPDNFTPYAYYPLIMFFPGKGMTAGQGQEMTGLDRLPAILVYPEPTLGKDNTWSWQGAPYSSGASDIEFVEDVLDKVQGQFCVDRTRVYASGLSNGGGLASLISCRLSDRFAAVGIVAGAMYEPEGSCQPKRPIPLINIHGDGDVIVPYLGSSTRHLPAIETWIATRAEDNGCSGRPVTSSPNATTTVMTWQFCQHQATVENIRLHGVGHIWLDDMPDTLWRFLSSHSL